MVGTLIFIYISEYSLLIFCLGFWIWGSKWQIIIMDAGYILWLSTCLSCIAFMSWYQRGNWEDTFLTESCLTTLLLFSMDDFEEGKETQCCHSAKTGFSLVMETKNQHVWISWQFTVMVPCCPVWMRWEGYNLHLKAAQMNCNDGLSPQNLPSAYLSQIRRFIVWICSVWLWVLQTVSC